MKRLEYKYLVPENLLPVLREMVLPYVEIDDYISKARKDNYTVRSIYFDTKNYNLYQEKISGIKLRKKVRIRSYNQETPSSPLFLEVKRKWEKTIRKNRAAILYKNIDSLFQPGKVEQLIMENNGGKRTIEDARQFYFQVFTSALHPVVLVSYEREAYFHKFNKTLRITFDLNVRGSLVSNVSHLFREENMLWPLKGFFILEVKFYGGLPGWLNSIIGRLGLVQQAISKYTTCLESNFNRHKFRMGGIPLYYNFLNPLPEFHIKRKNYDSGF